MKFEITHHTYNNMQQESPFVNCAKNCQYLFSGYSQRDLAAVSLVSKTMRQLVENYKCTADYCPSLLANTTLYERGANKRALSQISCKGAAIEKCAANAHVSCVRNYINLCGINWKTARRVISGVTLINFNEYERRAANPLPRITVCSEFNAKLKFMMVNRVLAAFIEKNKPTINHAIIRRCFINACAMEENYELIMLLHAVFTNISKTLGLSTSVNRLLTPGLVHVIATWGDKQMINKMIDLVGFKSFVCGSNAYPYANAAAWRYAVSNGVYDFIPIIANGSGDADDVMARCYGKWMYGGQRKFGESSRVSLHYFDIGKYMNVFGDQYYIGQKAHYSYTTHAFTLSIKNGNCVTPANYNDHLSANYIEGIIYTLRNACGRVPDNRLDPRHMERRMQMVQYMVDKYDCLAMPETVVHVPVLHAAFSRELHPFIIAIMKAVHCHNCHIAIYLIDASHEFKNTAYHDDARYKYMALIDNCTAAIIGAMHLPKTIHTANHMQPFRTRREFIAAVIERLRAKIGEPRHDQPELSPWFMIFCNVRRVLEMKYMAHDTEFIDRIKKHAHRAIVRFERESNKK
jgi:hypothetical protein